MSIRDVAAFGKALRNYREGYESSDRKAAALVSTANAMFVSVGLDLFDPPKEVTLALEAFDHTHAIAHTYHGRSAHEAAIRAAAEEIAKWADPPREERSDTDVSDLIADHGRAAE